MIELLNGWVYGLFGAEGLVLFQRHPLLYGGGALLVLGGAVTAVAAWLLRGVRRELRRVRTTFRLLPYPHGWQALRHAHGIRRHGRLAAHRLRRIQRTDPEARRLAEQVRRFVRQELDGVLAQLAPLLRWGTDQRLGALANELNRQTTSWATLPDGAEREAMQARIARVRQRYQRLAATVGRRDRILMNLQAAAEALEDLAGALSDLQHTRERPVAGLLDELQSVSSRVRALHRAHEELNASR